MRPDDDDDEEEGFGPPPDPSVRAWRHPSEIASAEAAAARMSRDESRREVWTAGFTGPATRPERPLGGIVLVTAALTLAAVAAGALAVTSLGAGLGPDAGSVAVGNLGATESSPLILGTDQRTSAFPPLQDTTTTLTLTTATSAAVVPTSGPQPTTAATRIDDDMVVDQAVYTEINGRKQRLAAFTIAGGMVFTSLSALGDHTELILGYGDDWVPAGIVDRDELTDVALLAPADLAEARRVAEQLGDDAAPTGLAGELSESDWAAPMGNGLTVYGTILTSTECPKGAAGSPLVDSGGRLLGMVIESSSPTMAAVPVADLLSFGVRKMDPAAAPPTWLGLTPDPAVDPAVTIRTVAPGSPAYAAGLEAGDVVLAVDGATLDGRRHLQHLIRHTSATTVLQLTILRHGKELTVPVTASLAPGVAAQSEI